MGKKSIWSFEVYNMDGENVTNERNWFVDKNGVLYYLSEGTYPSLVKAEDYWWSPQ